MFRDRFRSLPLLLLLLPVLGAANCKKKPDLPPPPPEPPPVQSIEVRLQVASIDPSSAEADTSIDAKVFGSGFKQGATVRFGNADGTRVRVLDENTLTATVPGLPSGNYDVTVTNPNGESSTLRSGLTIRAAATCKHARVHFDFDRAGLTSASRSTLDANMSCWQKLGGAIKIEGHADARGTVDYNLALGQRRAETVKKHLSGAGVSRSRLSTVSYGEERPLERGSGESVWAKNRRAEIHANE